MCLYINHYSPSSGRVIFSNGSAPGCHTAEDRVLYIIRPKYHTDLPLTLWSWNGVTGWQGWCIIIWFIVLYVQSHTLGFYYRWHCTSPSLLGSLLCFDNLYDFCVFGIAHFLQGKRFYFWSWVVLSCGCSVYEKFMYRSSVSLQFPGPLSDSSAKKSSHSNVLTDSDISAC